MTAEQLASQQLLTAWISAGAAVVQAGGAIAAILAAIHLARSSERRSIKLAAEAVEREQAAEAASIARAEAAEILAAKRSRWDRETEQDAIIDGAIELTDIVLHKLSNTISNLKTQPQAMTYLGTFTDPTIGVAQRGITELMRRTNNSKLSLALAALSDSLDGSKNWSSSGHLTPQFVQLHEVLLQQITAGRETVFTLRSATQ